MGILLLAGVATLIGLALIGLLIIAGPNPAARAASEAGANGEWLGAEGAWLEGLSRDEFERLLTLLFIELKFDVSVLEGELGGAVILMAVDPTPIKGVKILVYGVHNPNPPVLDADIVREVMEMVRGEEAGKGVVITPAQFTSDAQLSAQSLPIDLIDGRALLAQAKKHLPQVTAQKGF